LRLIDSCSTQLRAQGPYRTIGAKEEWETVRKVHLRPPLALYRGTSPIRNSLLLGTYSRTMP